MSQWKPTLLNLSIVISPILNFLDINSFRRADIRFLPTADADALFSSSPTALPEISATHRSSGSRLLTISTNLSRTRRILLQSNWQHHLLVQQLFLRYSILGLKKCRPNRKIGLRKLMSGMHRLRCRQGDTTRLILRSESRPAPHRGRRWLSWPRKLAAPWRPCGRAPRASMRLNPWPP